MSEEIYLKAEPERFDCPRCKGKGVLSPHDTREQCWTCDCRDAEERKAWVQFASARLTLGGHGYHNEVLDDANWLLEEFRQRFPYPAKPEAKE